ncbi:hypothetical protein CSAL01_08138 [Colletotrichum salicis]|uniref:Uncharacterized protein n=1 Tax=Colletotrichum salicis TaxID=1209931 RepID=A0A135UU84_9PEZI|nr:hypothetical protein CSAL01_08138 [Colletotrichum salicis]
MRRSPSPTLPCPVKLLPVLLSPYKSHPVAAFCPYVAHLRKKGTKQRQTETAPSTGTISFCLHLHQFANRNQADLHLHLPTPELLPASAVQHLPATTRTVYRTYLTSGITKLRRKARLQLHLTSWQQRPRQFSHLSPLLLSPPFLPSNTPRSSSSLSGPAVADIQSSTPRLT